MAIAGQHRYAGGRVDLSTGQISREIFVNGDHAFLDSCRHRGTVWATWDPAALPFLECLGEFKRYLDLRLDAWDGREGATECWEDLATWSRSGS